ncbi:MULTISPECIES: bifunctional hydroxymethylpyrimidine kinase/phosphomethylpyrimidine kinase [Salinibaculum]|uniref:bifunctional hydroxymethylpyrimidine kinase/phosphomethylpyrimidine kinase n=1 Tax=Salinibaculum TaxID=2732368 RepID=UPI0030CACA5F
MTRNPAPVAPPVVLTVAGSDSGGGAGIQADLKTMEAGGAFGTSVVTSVTAQNTTGVESTHVLPVEEIEAQAEAVLSDFDVAAVKTGMLATGEVIDLVREKVAATDAPAVVDPVMVATSGDRLLEPEAEAAYEDLVAASTLVTPNTDEAEVLTDIEVTDSASAQQAGEALVEMGADAALVKGGHVPGDDVVDVLVTADSVESVRHPRVDTEATHGSGCTLSSAIATRLAHGDDLSTAVRTGIDLLARAVRYNLDVGEGPGAVHHMVAVRDRAEHQPTVERVAELVDQFVTRDVSPLVPDVGMNVVGATPYAEVPTECAAVEGKITRTLDGVAPNRGVRFGASTTVARTLLAAREFDAELQFAVNCRLDADTEGALDALDGAVAECEATDGADAPTEQAIREALDASGDRPVAVVDRGGTGRVGTVTLLAADSAALADRTITLLDAASEE